MAFNNEELQIMQWGIQNGKSQQEIKDAVVRLRTTGSPQDPNKPIVEEPGFFQGIKEEAETRADRFGGILERKDAGVVEKGVQLFGQGAGLGASVIERTAEQIPGVKQAFGALGSGIQWLSETDFPVIFGPGIPPISIKQIGETIGGTEFVQEIVNIYDEDPNFKDTVDAVANIARLGGDVQLASDAVGLSKTIVNKLKTKITTPAPRGGGGGGDTGTLASKLDELGVFAGERTVAVGEKAGAITERVGTNIKTKLVESEAISKLPTQVQRTAVRQGVEIADVSEINRFFEDAVTSQTSKPLYKELADTAKAFSEAGGRGTDPIQVVGKPIVERIQFLNSNLGKIGKQLGEVANTLGDVTKPELIEAIFSRLQKVQGLSGLKMGETGILNFRDTVLASALSKADQKAIQQIFTEAIKPGTGKSKHLLRQELFEILGGKKSSQVTMTATQDKAFQAVRQGLSDVLEGQNALYKTLSNEYRKVISPLSKTRKLLKDVSGEAGENIDLLELEAGMLARRLTSTSISRAQVEALLRELDAVGLELGGSAVSTRNLQEFYNILNKYYDLSPKTGFQGQIKGAFEGGGILDRIIKTVTGTVGQTPEVRQAALEKLINELIGS